MPRKLPLLIAPFLALVGCGPPADHRVAVSGRVSYKGQPLSDAAIFFVPDVDKEGQGGNGAISNGHYSIPAEWGPSPGQFSVLITDARAESEKKKDDGSKPPRIPARYAEMNALHITIPAKKSYSFDFELIDEPDAPLPGLKPSRPVD